MTQTYMYGICGGISDTAQRLDLLLQLPSTSLVFVGAMVKEAVGPFSDGGTFVLGERRAVESPGASDTQPS